MSYREAIEMLAQRMDICERLEASSMGFSYENQGRARAEGRYATQVLARLTGKPYDAAVFNLCMFSFVLPWEVIAGTVITYGLAKVLY